MFARIRQDLLTVSGLIMKHGLMARTTSRVRPSSSRTGMCLRFIWACRVMTPAAPPAKFRGRRALHTSMTAPAAAWTKRLSTS